MTVEPARPAARRRAIDPTRPPLLGLSRAERCGTPTGDAPGEHDERPVDLLQVLTSTPFPPSPDDDVRVIALTATWVGTEADERVAAANAEGAMVAFWRWPGAVALGTLVLLRGIGAAHPFAVALAAVAHGLLMAVCVRAARAADAREAGALPLAERATAVAVRNGRVRVVHGSGAMFENPLDSVGVARVDAAGVVLRMAHGTVFVPARGMRDPASCWFALEGDGLDPRAREAGRTCGAWLLAGIAALAAASLL